MTTHRVLRWHIRLRRSMRNALFFLVFLFSLLRVLRLKHHLLVTVYLLLSKVHLWPRANVLCRILFWSTLVLLVFLLNFKAKETFVLMVFWLGLRFSHSHRLKRLRLIWFSVRLLSCKLILRRIISSDLISTSLWRLGFGLLISCI